jgi:thiosulfate/3-mercaptopyruvate sulfurtransferase
MSSVSVVRRVFVAAVLVAVAALSASAAPVEPLVSAQWLKDHLRDPQIAVIDVRMGAPVYDAGHIPGAVHSDYDKAGWRVSRNGVLQPPNKAELEKLIGETGIDEDSHVIVVPAGVSATDFGAAARVYWTLKVAGHPAVSILDGGFNAWQAAAYPVATGKTVPTPKIFSLRFDEGLLAELAAVENNEHATLVDARPASYFNGKEKAAASKAYGHIPGAINLDSASFYDPATNRLRPKDQLARIAAKLPSGPVVTYCNTGHWAATDWFVLSAVLGRPDVRLYPGSMVEWSASPNRPIASSRTRLDDLKKALGLGS